MSRSTTGKSFIYNSCSTAEIYSLLKMYFKPDLDPKNGNRQMLDREIPFWLIISIINPCQKLFLVRRSYSAAAIQTLEAASHRSVER